MNGGLSARSSLKISFEKMRKLFFELYPKALFVSFIPLLAQISFEIKQKRYPFQAIKRNTKQYVYLVMAINLMAITAFDFVAKLLKDGRKQPDEIKKAAFPLFRGKPLFFYRALDLRLRLCLFSVYYVVGDFVGVVVQTEGTSRYCYVPAEGELVAAYASSLDCFRGV